jgi:hypothetical protein
MKRFIKSASGISHRAKVQTDEIMEIKPIPRFIEMFFGRCKRKNKAAMSIAEMDKAIEQAVSKASN